MKRDMMESECIREAAAVAAALIRALRAGGKVLFFGNGGSSMDSGHLAAELAGRFYRDRPGLAALSLADGTASLTAIANDYAYQDVFARQVRALGRPGDVAVGLTTSGNSGNVVDALTAAREGRLVHRRVDRQSRWEGCCYRRHLHPSAHRRHSAGAGGLSPPWTHDMRDRRMRNVPGFLIRRKLTARHRVHCRTICHERLSLYVEQQADYKK